jgi:cell division protein FtsZ
MTIQFAQNSKGGADIKVIGVGGAGSNAVNTMVALNIESVECIVANTDKQALNTNRAPIRVQIGKVLTKGLGAGSNPEVGKNAAVEDLDIIKQVMEGADMVFITAGMGGGTGTGAAPIIAETARSIGILTVGVVTKPFEFEGNRRKRVAGEGIKELEKHVDSLITIPNERLFTIAGKKTSLLEGFKMADEVLVHAINSISNLINVPGLINLDFADVKTIMSNMGRAYMGIGIHSGENRAAEAARKAISNPLLDDISISGAKGLLINIKGSSSLAFEDLDEATNFIRMEADKDANIIFGAAIDDTMEEALELTVIATGFNNKTEDAVGTQPQECITQTVGAHVPRAGLGGQKKESNIVKIGTIISEYADDPDYDTPTFVRKQQSL